MSRLERQISDKHLKRRTQLLKVEGGTSSRSNSSSSGSQYQPTNYNSPFPKPEQDQNNGGLSSLVVHESHKYRQQPRMHRGRKHGTFFSFAWGHGDNHQKAGDNTMFAILLIAVVLALLLLVTILEHSLLSSTFDTTQVAGPFLPDMEDQAMMEMDGILNDGDVLRSYEDLANTIRSVRTRRQIMKEEVGAGVDQHQDKVFPKPYTDNNRHEEQDPEEIRLQRLEEKILKEQSEKVRQELHKETATNLQEGMGFTEQHQHSNEVVELPQFQQEQGDIAGNDRDQLLSESIAALKRVNDQNSDNG